MKKMKDTGHSVVNSDGSPSNVGASTSPKINAFQFMMNNRHKSIGRNSPGREITVNEPNEEAVSKKVLKERKSRLENWSDAKGAAKRKREYEEIGNCINYKLEKREKKLRKMLKIDTQSDDEIVVKPKRKCAVIDSDSENETPNRAVLTPRTIKMWKFKIKLNMKENESENSQPTQSENNTEMTVENNSDNSQPTASLKNEKTENNSDNSQFTPSDKSGMTVENDSDNSQPSTSFKNEMTVENNSDNSQPISSDKTEITFEDNSHNPQSSASDKTEMTVEDNSDNSQPSASLKNEMTVENMSDNSQPTPSNHSGITVENDSDSSQLPNSENETVNQPIVTTQSNDSDIDIIEVENDSENTRRRSLRVRKPKKYNEFLLSDSDEEKSSKTKDKKKKLKVAPVFLKAAPKPKLDPEVIEARRQFLMSGIPSSLKKEIEKIQNEEADFDVFPTISHVQQKSSDITFWDLPKVDLKLINPEIEFEIPPCFKNLLNIKGNKFKEEFIIPERIKNCKKLIKEIKTQNPNYPVFKVFNSLYEKSGYKTEKIPLLEEKVPKRRGRKKKNSLDKTSKLQIPVKTEDSQKYAMWTEKYKPKSSSDIIGNYNSVSALKDWLSNWSKAKIQKKSDSESDFDITDSDSRDSVTFGNTVILKGPSGSGKTAAIYAICNELGFDILEVNASSKRTGKRLLQELQEATQSHQVHKENVFFIKSEKRIMKKCVLLVEDIDVVFDQDEGFCAALSQIMSTSKRPIVLTMTEEASSSVQKVINDCQVFNFLPLTSILTVWLQILCVVEGYFVDMTSLAELLSYSRGDIRRALLQLQFFITSGGQLDKNETVIETNDCPEVVKLDDDNSNLSDLNVDDTSDVQIHYNCVGSKQILVNYELFSLPHCNNLEMIWWNLARILNLPDFSKCRLQREKYEDLVRKKVEKRKLQTLADCYDSLAFADVICDKNKHCESLEPTWRIKEKDSLVLDQNFLNYDRNFENNLAQILLSGRINFYKKNFENTKSGFNISVPVSEERRWRSKQIMCQEKLQGALLPTEFLQRRAVALDYMPTLRTIARSEFERAAQNTKRGNRFYNYLKNLGVHGGDSVYKSACDVFQI